MTEDRPAFHRELYPFLYREEARTESDLDHLVAEVRASTLQKCRDVVALRRHLLAEYGDALIDTAAAMAAAFARGGKLLAFGNGGSATDAEDAVVDCLAPSVAGWRALPAVSLTDDVGVVTGVANDVGFEHVFARQIVALGDAGDIALGFSTSGSSPSILAALTEAKRRTMVTIALLGYDGGAVAREGIADHAFIARLEYVPRIQEGHATVWHTLLELTQAILAAPRAGAGA